MILPAIEVSVYFAAIALLLAYLVIRVCEHYADKIVGEMPDYEQKYNEFPWLHEREK